QYANVSKLLHRAAADWSYPPRGNDLDPVADRLPHCFIGIAATKRWQGQDLAHDFHAAHHMAESGVTRWPPVRPGIEIGTALADDDEEIAHRRAGLVARHRYGTVDMTKPGLTRGLVRDGRKCPADLVIDP